MPQYVGGNFFLLSVRYTGGIPPTKRLIDVLVLFVAAGLIHASGWTCRLGSLFGLSGGRWTDHVLVLNAPPGRLVFPFSWPLSGHATFEQQ